MDRHERATPTLKATGLMPSTIGSGAISERNDSKLDLPSISDVTAVLPASRNAMLLPSTKVMISLFAGDGDHAPAF
jgi:hypothetical protein